MKVIQHLKKDDKIKIPCLPVSHLVGHDEGPIPIVQFTANGKYCLTAGSDRTVRLWNPSRLDPAYPPTSQLDLNALDIPVSHLPRALPIQVYEVRYTASALTVDNETSTRLLVASDKTAILFDTVTAKELRQFRCHTATINSVDMVTSDVMISGSYDATVCIWDGRSSNVKPIQILKDSKDSVTVVRFVNNDKIRTASVDGCIRTYDIRKGLMTCDDCNSPITSLSHYEQYSKRFIAISCLDGCIRIKTDDTDELIDVPTQDTSLKQITNTIPCICQGMHKAGSFGLECSFSSDGSYIVSGSEDGRAVLYGLNNKFLSTSYNTTKKTAASPVAELIGHTSPTCSVSAHPKQNDVVVTASYDGNCIVWAGSRDYMRWVD